MREIAAKIAYWGLFVLAIGVFILVIFNQNDLRYFIESWIGFICSVLLLILAFPGFKFVSGSTKTKFVKLVVMAALAVASLSFLSVALKKYHDTPKGKAEWQKLNKEIDARQERLAKEESEERFRRKMKEASEDNSKCEAYIQAKETCAPAFDYRSCMARIAPTSGCASQGVIGPELDPADLGL